MKTRYRFLTISLIGLLLGVMVASTVYALPPGQDPRPPDNGGDSGSGGSSSGDSNGGNGNGQQSSSVTCAALNGQVLSWGVGPMSGVGVSLETGSWQIAAVSGSEGGYAFGGMGMGVARLKVALAPELGGNLTPLIQDAGVYLNCNAPTIANIAVYSGKSIRPPVTLELSAATGLTRGKDTVIRARIKNSLPNGITNVILTSLMPSGLTPTKIDFTDNTAQAVEILDDGAGGQMVYIYYDSIAAGKAENISITVNAASDLRVNGPLKNTATLFYRESVAVQDSIDMAVDGAPLPAAAPATATPTLPITETVAGETAATPLVTTTVAAEATAAVSVTVTATPTLQAPATPTATVQADDLSDEFVPPSQMPTTGDNDAAEFVAPPSHMPTTGDDSSAEFVAPPGLLPETGVDPTLPQTLPNTGIGFLLPLLGMGFGGLAFALHQLRRRF